MSGRLDHSNDASDDTSSGRVVVGVHGSASSMDAVRWAAALARGQGWDLEIVAAWPDADDVFIHDVPGRFIVSRGAAAEALGRAEETVEGLQGRVSTFLVNARPVAALLSRAGDASLVVVGAGRPAVERDRPSVGAELTACRCPVLVVGEIGDVEHVGDVDRRERSLPPRAAIPTAGHRRRRAIARGRSLMEVSPGPRRLRSGPRTFDP